MLIEAIDCVKQAIVAFDQDKLGDWVAVLACGHSQHVRHDPPWEVREWVTTTAGRDSMIGHEIDCRLCDESAESP